MYVTKDKYRLPLAVADTKTELAHLVGKPVQAIWHGLDLAERGKSKNSHYETVWIDEADE
jgi:hypothetical protein